MMYVSLSLCLYTHRSIHIDIYMYVCTSTYKCIQHPDRLICIHIYTYEGIYMCLYIYIYISMCVHIIRDIRIGICTYCCTLYVNVYIYIYIDIYAYMYHLFFKWFCSDMWKPMIPYIYEGLDLRTLCFLFWGRGLQLKVASSLRGCPFSSWGV